MRSRLSLIPLAVLASGVTSAAVLNVPVDGDLQSALNTAQPGDTVALAPGATYVGYFTLPANYGSSYITITTADPSSLPGVGDRVTPASAASLPKIVAPGSASAITTAPNANHYILRGIEVTVSPGVYAVDLVNIASSDGTNLSSYPNDIIIDRCYIHGDPNVGGKRGIALNGANVVIEDSYISDFKSSIQQSQAIAGWTGPGPFEIVNNYLEGGQGILFGGAAPSVYGLVPTDIEILRNYIAHPLSWKGVWPVINLLELKNAQNVLISSNVFENNWASAQDGFGILFTVRTCESGDYEWAVVKNVTFSDNLVVNSDQGINILGRDNDRSGCGGPAWAGQTSNILIQSNLFEQIGLTVDGTFLQVLNSAKNIVANHNTVFQGGKMVIGDGTPSTGFVFTNNITLYTSPGVVGDSTAEGTASLNTYFPGWIFADNVLANSPGWVPPVYPAGNFFPPSLTDVGFLNYANGDYSLAIESPYKCASTDGTDIGANIEGVSGLTSGVAGGQNPPRFIPLLPTLQNLLAGSCPVKVKVKQ